MFPRAINPRLNIFMIFPPGYLHLRHYCLHLHLHRCRSPSIMLPPPLVGGSGLTASSRHTMRNGTPSRQSHLPYLGEYIDLSVEFHLTILLVSWLTKDWGMSSLVRKTKVCKESLCISWSCDLLLLLHFVIFVVEGLSM